MKPVLGNISGDLATLLNARGHKRTYAEDARIFTEGDPAGILPILISGAVKMIHSPEAGKEVIIGIFREGEMFALPPVFDGGPYPATAVAIENSELLEIKREDFLSFLHESAEFAFAVIAWTCEMLREKNATIRNLASASPEYRVASVLAKLVNAQPPVRFPIQIPVRRQDIAEMASLTTETTIRVIRRFADKKMLRIVHGKIFIDETASLQTLLKD